MRILGLPLSSFAPHPNDNSVCHWCDLPFRTRCLVLYPRFLAKTDHFDSLADSNRCKCSLFLIASV